MDNLSFNAEDVKIYTAVGRKQGIAGATIASGKPLYIDFMDDDKLKLSRAVDGYDNVVGISVCNAVENQPVHYVNNQNLVITSAPFTVSRVYAVSSDEGMITPIENLAEVGGYRISILGVASTPSTLSVNVIPTFGISGSVTGSQTMNVTTKTSNYTTTTEDGIVLCDASGGAFTITLHAASSDVGRLMHIKKKESSTNLVILDGSGSETLDEELTKSLNAYASLSIASDGTEWFIL